MVRTLDFLVNLWSGFRILATPQWGSEYWFRLRLCFECRLAPILIGDDCCGILNVCRIHPNSGLFGHSTTGLFDVDIPSNWTPCADRAGLVIGCWQLELLLELLHKFWHRHCPCGIDEVWRLDLEGPDAGLLCAVVQVSDAGLDMTTDRGVLSTSRNQLFLVVFLMEVLMLCSESFCFSL